MPQEDDKDVLAAIESHCEPLNPPAWDRFSIPAWSSMRDGAEKPSNGSSSAFWPQQASRKRHSPRDLTELARSLYRAHASALRLRRQSFLGELLADLTVYPYTQETALQAGCRATEPRCCRPVLRLALRCNSTLARVLGGDRKRAALPAGARSLRRAVPIADEYPRSPPFVFSRFLHH
jgi:hypothetical protein